MKSVAWAIIIAALIWENSYRQAHFGKDAGSGPVQWLVGGVSLVGFTASLLLP